MNKQKSIRSLNKLREKYIDLFWRCYQLDIFIRKKMINKCLQGQILVVSLVPVKDVYVDPSLLMALK